ncbi:MAG: transporter substrate-binding domain-containing protein [Pseudomonadota bacterium]
MTIRTAICTLFLVATAIMAGPVAHAEQSLTISTGEYAPFTDSSVVGGGTVNAIVSQIAEKSGLTAQFEYMPWMRALELTRVGRFDATSFWYFSAERKPEFIHVGPVLHDRLVFFRRADMPDQSWEELEDLSAFKIGAVTGYTYAPEFWQYADEDRIDVEIAPDDEANLRKLLAGRIDLYPMSEQVGRRLIETKFSKADQARFAVISKPLIVTEGYLLVSRAIEGADALAARLQEAVDTLDPVTN